jgi:hypothetical protein
LNGLDLITAGLPTRIRSGSVYHHRKQAACFCNTTASGAGWLVFGRDGALLAQPFDSRQFDFTGEPFLLSEKVGSDLGYINYYTFSVSDNGVLVFDPSLKRQRRLYVGARQHRSQWAPSSRIPANFNCNYPW